MARIRSIKPEFWQDERMASVSVPARLLFIGMWNLADDFGVLRANPRLLKGQVFPYDEIDVTPLLAELERASRIVRYRPDGEDLALVRNFTKHQKLDRRTKHRPPLPAGYRIAEVDGEDAEGKPGRVLRVLEDAPPNPADNPAGSADSPRQVGGDGRAPPIPPDPTPNPAAGRDGTGRDGSGPPRAVAAAETTPSRSASKPTDRTPGQSEPPSSGFVAGVALAWEQIRPSAIPAVPDPGTMTAFVRDALTEAKGRSVADLVAGYREYLRDAYWTDAGWPWNGWREQWKAQVNKATASQSAAHGGRMLRPVKEAAP